MSVTYDHNPRCACWRNACQGTPNHNPHPLSVDAISRATMMLDNAGCGHGPLVGPADIMGFKLSPSPELNGAGAGTLEVDYADGTTSTFDVDSDGTITPRRRAFAFAVVIEKDAAASPDVSGDLDAIYDRFQRQIVRAFPGTSPFALEFVSGAVEIERNTGSYDVQPRDESAGGRNR